MKRNILLLTLALTMVFTGTAFATNGYQLIGIGQMQKSMGGAVTAAPMDAMTAITNPAGMARIGQRADFSVEAFMPGRSVDFSAAGGGDTMGGTELYGIPSIGWTAKAFGRDDMYFGGGMFVTSGLGVDYEQIIYMPGAAIDFMTGSASGTYSDVNYSGYSSLQFWKMAPTVAWNVNDDLSVGFALNMDYQSVAIDQKINNIPLSAAGATMMGVSTMNVNFDLGRPTSQMGFGATIGGLYNIGDMVVVGASYSTPQSFSEAEFRVADGAIYNYMGATGMAGTYKMDLQFPMQAALGVAVTPVDKLLVAFDVKWINWSATHDKVKFSGPSGAFMTSTGSTTDSIDLEFGWEDQTIIALGVQYAAMENLKVRAGYNYGNSPIGEEDVFNNLVFPAIVEQHISLGADYSFDEHWGMGATYMKASKATLTGKGDVDPTMQQMTAFGEDSMAEISLEEDSFGVQLSYNF